MTCSILCIGMAGSGKTTFMQRLNSYLHTELHESPYVLNLDPAVNSTPYPANIDIRDSVNYGKVMEDYGLGPNGAIITTLNLFATKIDQVVNILEKRAPEHKHIIADTPGQIECFIWSASGQIITDAFASSFPTMIAYIVDTPSSASPATFMSNMLYACSILYKTKLPMIVVFNKTDLKNADFAREWMTDFEAFQAALAKQREQEGGEGGYMDSLMTSMSLVLEEFYNTLDVVAVSSLTGDGFDNFMEAVERKTAEFNTDYTAERERIKKVQEERAAEQKAKDLERLLKDVGVEKREPADVLSDLEDEGDDDDDDEYEEDDGLGRSSTGIQDRYRQTLDKTQPQPKLNM